MRPFPKIHDLYLGRVVLSTVLLTWGVLVGLDALISRTPAVGTVGPGRSSTDGQKIGVATTNGVSGWPSRTVSRKPWTAGTNARSRIVSPFTTLMPSLRLIRSAGASRMTRAANWSIWH